MSKPAVNRKILTSDANFRPIWYWPSVSYADYFPGRFPDTDKILGTNKNIKVIELPNIWQLAEFNKNSLLRNLEGYEHSVSFQVMMAMNASLKSKLDVMKFAEELSRTSGNGIYKVTIEETVAYMKEYFMKKENPPEWVDSIQGTFINFTCNGRLCKVPAAFAPEMHTPANGKQGYAIYNTITHKLLLICSEYFAIRAAWADRSKLPKHYRKMRRLARLGHIKEALPYLHSLNLSPIAPGRTDGIYTRYEYIDRPDTPHVKGKVNRICLMKDVLFGIKNNEFLSVPDDMEVITSIRDNLLGDLAIVRSCVDISTPIRNIYDFRSLVEVMDRAEVWSKFRIKKVYEHDRKMYFLISDAELTTDSVDTVEQKYTVSNKTGKWLYLEGTLDMVFYMDSEITLLANMYQMSSGRSFASSYRVVPTKDLFADNERLKLVSYELE